MDVFNGLEDVRQYFQGLPAATGTTASPGYQHQSAVANNNNGPDQNHHEQQQQQQRSAAAVPYWPPQHEAAPRPVPARENTPQRPQPPSSHHSDVSATRPPSHHALQQQQQQQHVVDAKSRYANYINHESAPQPQQAFQFSVPHSREAPSNSTSSGQQSPYQSHILPNPSYHQGGQQQQQQQLPRSNSSRPDMTSPQSYHQLQPPQNPQNQAQQQQQTYSYQNRSYYSPSLAKSATTSINSYNKAVANQAYNYDAYKPYAPPQVAMQNNSPYATAQKSPSHANLDVKEQTLPNTMNHNPQPQQQQQQQHKTTHNLPPIAALSNYHPGRSREALRAPTKNKLASTTATSSSTATTASHLASIKQYSLTQQPQTPHQIPRVPPANPDVNYRNVSQYSIPNYHHASSYYSIAPTSSSSSSNNNNYGANSYQQSSPNHQNLRASVGKATNHETHPQTQYQPSPNSAATAAPSAVDSVLDLSLKTIKTSADSTLDDAEDGRGGKYYQVRQHQQMQAYQSNQTNQTGSRNMQRAGQNQGQGQVSAPKVDFLPNFNMPMSQNYKPDRRQVPAGNSYDKTYHHHHQLQQQQQQVQVQAQPVTQQQQQQHQPLNTAQHFNPAYMANNKKAAGMEGLPRIDFPSSNQIQKSGLYQNPHDGQRKRSAQQLSTVVQNKRPKMDDRWKQVIDKQIEQKFSSYQSAKPISSSSKELIVNGNFISSNDNKNNAYQPNQYHQMQPHHQYANNQSYHHQMNQTYVPSAAAHHYPSHITHGQPQQIHPQQQQQQHPLYQANLPRSNSHSNLNNGRNNQQLSNNNNNNNNGGADKRVISILRSNLEMKGAKEAQKKMEQVQFKSYEYNQRPREVQHPSTDVTAPLQPKHGFIGRQNVSPFTAASLIERSTPPTYKFPKAIDSVRFEADIKEEKADQLTNQADLDGLAANLAARIRTKGELKQVAQSQQHLANYIRLNSPGLTETTSINGAQFKEASPSKEKAAYPPRRRLFSRNEEDPNEHRGIAPPRDKTGLRSSSETSVFDFPDSGDESEVPVSERQSLEDMRRDRKSISKQSLVNESDFREEKSAARTDSPIDDIFNQACDNFVEQLMKSGGKKRGRRKKMEPDVLAKLETVTKEKPLEEIVVKLEEMVAAKEPVSIQEVPAIIIVPPSKLEEESDSDVPLSKCKKEIALDPPPPPPPPSSSTPIQAETEKITYCSSDSETETSKTDEEKKRKTSKLKEQIRKTKELHALLDISTTIAKPPKKPIFGDGSDFHPGWEEELYKYKKSLRMPRNLIQVTRPPNCNRLSTSLPDLDPCRSPTPSSVTDGGEFCKFKSKTKSETFDSDVDSNSSFNFSLTKNYDSEEGSSSVKSLNVSNKITDRLLERYGGKKRKRLKKKEEQTPKIIPKSDNALELLPTPSLEVKTDESNKKAEAVVNTESVFFGFRKKTVDNFKDTFIKNSKKIVGVGEQFTTVVMKSRTRTETRVLKQKATIREVFGEDRPASAPPVTCLDESKDRKTIENKDSNPQTTKEVLKNKLLNRGKKSDPERINKEVTSTVVKQIDDPIVEKDEVKPETDVKSETPSLDGEENNTNNNNNNNNNKKKNKFRNIRRKGSSGFDYIRKKKKQVKKDTGENDTTTPTTKNKRRSGLPKANLESVQDIQKEIKMWVLNKGIGETHLHRSARLGYTDITAYCLEKMQCSPSPKDNAGYTPLHEACSRGHLDIAKLLLMYGANASESAQGGIRPLHEAAENGFVEIVRLLLSYGADPNLATYSGSTPMSLAAEECTVSLLKNHIDDVQGIPSDPWNFHGPASCFDPEETGYDPLESPPLADPPVEDEDIDFEVSEVLLPNLYTLADEPPTDRWVLLQDLSNLLKIKSKDALLKQINPPCPTTSTSTASSSPNSKSILRELKMADFLEKARCCQFLNAGEKINTRSSKVALVKYTDKVRQLLNVEKEVIEVR